MNEGQKQIALWLSLPIIGLLLLLSVFLVQGAVYVVAPIALVLGVVVLFVFLSGRKRG